MMEIFSNFAVLKNKPAIRNIHKNKKYDTQSLSIYIAQG